MKSTSFLLFLALTGSFLSAVSSTRAADTNATSNAADTAAKNSATELDAKLARLWANRPDYVARLQLKDKSDRPLRIVSSVPPESSKALRRAKIKGTVVVSFFVGEDGRVEAARVVSSPDERLNEPSVAAILKWKFLPAMRGDKPVKTAAMQLLVWN